MVGEARPASMSHGKVALARNDGARYSRRFAPCSRGGRQATQGRTGETPRIVARRAVRRRGSIDGGRVLVVRQVKPDAGQESDVELFNCGQSLGSGATCLPAPSTIERGGFLSCVNSVGLFHCRCWPKRPLLTGRSSATARNSTSAVHNLGPVAIRQRSTFAIVLATAGLSLTITRRSTG